MFFNADACGWEITDDFSDDSLDESIWDSPYGDVWVSGEECHIHQRGYLNTLHSYEPAVYNIEAECDVIFQSDNDFIDVVIRSDGTRNPSFFNEVMNGIKFSFKPIDAYSIPNGASIDYFVSGAIERSPNHVVYADPPNNQPLYHIRAVDLGDTYELYVDGVLVTTGNGVLPTMGDLVTFYNREFDLTLRIDNIHILATM